MKTLIKLCCTLATALLLIVPVANAQEKNVYEDDKTVEFIKIDSNLTLEKKNDGRVFPIFRSKNTNLTITQQDAILEEMNFTEDEINTMIPSIKQELATTGGVKVNVETKLLQYFNSSGGNRYLITDDNRNEIEALRQQEAAKLSKELDKEITIQPLSTSVSDGKFSAHGYVTYQGKSPNAMEFEFRYIDAFEWSSSPNYQYTDKIAHAWQAHTTSISSYARTIQTLPGATNDNYLSVTSEGAYASSAEIQFVSQVFNNLKGYLVDNVRIPISNSGTTGKYVGAYAHPWSMLEPSISVGPISVGYGGFIGDEWSWETTYTISSSL